GSVTFTAITLAPISLAKKIPCSTALAAKSDPSVATRMFLNTVALLLSVLLSNGKIAENHASVDQSDYTASSDSLSSGVGERHFSPTMAMSRSPMANSGTRRPGALSIPHGHCEAVVADRSK